MFRIRIIVLIGALMAALALPACGGDESPSSSSTEPERSDTPESEVAAEETEEPEDEEEVSDCVGKRKGPVTTVRAGKLGDDFGNQVKFYPDKLELPAGKFVTLKLVYGNGPTHNFRIDELNCDAGIIAAGDEVFVSFKVPKGTTPFYCQPHEDAGMKGEIIAR